MAQITLTTLFCMVSDGLATSMQERNDNVTPGFRPNTDTGSRVYRKGNTHRAAIKRAEDAAFVRAPPLDEPHATESQVARSGR